MKIKEAIISSINLEGNEEVSQEFLQGVGPFAFTWFTVALAAVYTCAAIDLLSKDMPTIAFGETEVDGKGKSIQAATCLDLLRVFNGNDMLRHAGLFQQALQFFKWYFEQEAPEGLETEEGDLLTWSDFRYMEKKWNEYAKSCRDQG